MRPDREPRLGVGRRRRSGRTGAGGRTGPRRAEEGRGRAADLRADQLGRGRRPTGDHMTTVGVGFASWAPRKGNVGLLF